MISSYWQIYRNLTQCGTSEMPPLNDYIWQGSRTIDQHAAEDRELEWYKLIEMGGFKCREVVDED